MWQNRQDVSAWRAGGRACCCGFHTILQWSHLRKACMWKVIWPLMFIWSGMAVQNGNLSALWLNQAVNKHTSFTSSNEIKTKSDDLTRAWLSHSTKMWVLRLWVIVYFFKAINLSVTECWTSVCKNHMFRFHLAWDTFLTNLLSH